eukprot:scaffold19723_cov97-Phaeocystis_antarctica.AAC.3
MYAPELQVVYNVPLRRRTWYHGHAPIYGPAKEHLRAGDPVSFSNLRNTVRPADNLLPAGPERGVCCYGDALPLQPPHVRVRCVGHPRVILKLNHCRLHTRCCHQLLDLPAAIVRNTNVANEPFDFRVEEATPYRLALSACLLEHAVQ